MTEQHFMASLTIKRVRKSPASQPSARHMVQEGPKRVVHEILSVNITASTMNEVRSQVQGFLDLTNGEAPGVEIDTEKKVPR